MLLGDIVNQLFNKHRLSDTGTTEQSDLTTFKVRLQKVDNLDTCVKNFLRCSQVFKLRRFAVDGESSFFVEGLHAVNGIAHHIHHTSFYLVAHRHCDSLSRRYYFHTTLQPVGAIHCHGTYCVFTDVLLYLNHKCTSIISLDGKCIVNFWQGSLNLVCREIEVHIDYRADNLRNVSNDF